MDFIEKKKSELLNQILIRRMRKIMKIFNDSFY